MREVPVIFSAVLTFLQSEALQLSHHMEMQLVRMLSVVLYGAGSADVA